MALLTSDRLRLNFNSQVFAHGAPGHQPLVFIFVKNTVPFISDTVSQFDYYNSVLNWSANDGGSTSNRANMLGYCCADSSSPVGAFVPSVEGLFINWYCPITVVSSGTIGSVLVMHKGQYLTPTTYTTSAAPIIPSPLVTSFAANHIAIPEATSSTNYTALGGGTVSWFDGTSYVYNPATTNTQTASASMFYQNVVFSSDSVGTTNNTVLRVSSLDINSTDTTYFMGMRLSITEGV